MFSVYGIASAVLGIVSVVAVVLGLLIWSEHRDNVDEHHYQGRVLRTAAGWTTALISVNSEDLHAGMERLHEKTTGELHVDFDTAIAPIRENLGKLNSRSIGRIESLAIETLHKDLEGAPAGADRQPPPDAARTDTVLVVATSLAENPAAKIKGVRWQLYVDVSKVGDDLLISRLGAF